MKVRLLKDVKTPPKPAFPNGVMPAGTIIEEPTPSTAWVLQHVRSGIAEAVDDEAITCLRNKGLDARGRQLPESPPPPAKPKFETRPAPPTPAVQPVKQPVKIGRPAREDAEKVKPKDAGS